MAQPTSKPITHKNAAGSNPKTIRLGETISATNSRRITAFMNTWVITPGQIDLVARNASVENTVQHKNMGIVAAAMVTPVTLNSAMWSLFITMMPQKGNHHTHHTPATMR